MFALLLHSLLGRLIGGLISVAILAGTWFLIVEPQIDEATEQLDDAGQGDRAREGEREGKRARQRARRLTRCLARADGNPRKSQRCLERFGP